MYFLNQDKRKIIHLSICILFSFIALLSKMDAIGFLLFGISYLFFYKTGKKTVYILIGIAAVFILFSVVSAIPGMLFSTDASTALKGKVTFTENPLALDFTIMNRCIAFTNTIFFYFTKLVPVSGFRYYYGYNYYAILSTTSFSFVGGLFILSSFIIILFFAFTKKQKTIVLSIFGVFLCSLYALNFIAPVAGIIADRYVFIANLFFCLFIASLLRFILLYLNKPTLIRHTFTIVAIIFFVISILRIPAWKNFKTLIDTDAQALSDSYEAMRIAAGAYFKEYESETNETAKQTYLDKSIYYAEKGVQVYPKNFLLYLFLGQYYFKANQPDKAIQSFKSSIKNDTSTADGFVYLGDVFYALKKPDSAIFYYKNGLHIEPKSQILINNISSIYYELNDKENCLKFNNDLLAKDSTTFAAHENLGYFYLDSKDTLQAISYFKSAVKYGLDATSLPIKIQ
jgi:cytochrome c-type biogenesis protein CcmH/NrfG